MNTYKQIDCFNKNLQFWKFLGIYPLDINWSFYTHYSIFFVLFFTITYDVVCTINLYFLPNHIDDYIEELIFYFTELAAMSKVLTFVFMGDKIRDILSTLESDIFQPETPKARKIINNTKIFYMRYWKIFGIVSGTSNLVHVISPFLTHLILKVELILPICSYSFLSDDVKEAFIYPLYFYQCIGMHFIMLYDVNIDTFILGLMVFIIAQLEILEEKLITITKDFKEETKNNQNNATQNDAVFVLRLNKAVIHYNEVIRFCRLVEKVFSISLFAQFGVGSGIICICLFRFTMPATWQYYIFLATYISVMIVQIMVPSWFGTRIMDKSCALSHAIYSCDWTPRSKEFKSSMRLFVERANRPLSITGWKMFPLSLTTFTSIMNSAYSFYTLLRHMQSK